MEKREILGKKVGALRRKGILPAELYGRGISNVHLAVDTKEFEKLYGQAGENTVVNVVVDGTSRPVLIHDVHIHPLTNTIQSVDLYEVKMDEEIETMVPLEFVGESKAVKEGIGVFVEAMDEIEVEALPGDIPSKIVVDISSLSDVGESLYVKDLRVTGKFKFTIDMETVIASIAEIELEEDQTLNQITPEQVVVETEEKKAGREAAKSVGHNEA